MNKRFPILAALLLLFSLIGFIDATYLTAKHFLGSPVECSILEGCDTVTTSKYAAVFGIPVALGGALYYLIVFLLAMTYTETKNERVLQFTARFTIVGFLASVWFVYLQIFVIQALCLYCLVSAATSTAIFIIGVTLLQRLRKTQ